MCTWPTSAEETSREGQLDKHLSLQISMVQMLALDVIALSGNHISVLPDE